MVSFHCRLISSFHEENYLFRQFGAELFSEKILHALFLSDITLRTYSRDIKHFDVTLELAKRYSARDVSPTAASSGVLKSQNSSYSFIYMTF